MANKKISTEAIEEYKTEVTEIVTEIDDTYTSLKKITAKIDSISDECEIENLNIASHFTDSPSDDMEACLRGISTAFDNALKKAQDNDNKLKDKMTSRSTEINQLKGIISQYKTHVGSKAPMSSLAGTLSSIGRANFIDRIPGVVEGRQKRVELETKWNSAVLTDEQLLAKIKDSYRNLSDEDIKELMQYYRIMNTPQIVRGLASKGKQVILLNENGKYRVADLDWDNNFKESVMKGSTSVDLDLPGSVNIDQDFSKGSKPSIGLGTDFGGSVNVSGNMYNAEYGDNTKINVGNVEASASIKPSEVGVNAGSSLIDINHSFTTNEDDLYRYGVDVSVKVISGEISAKLSQDGFELGASNGLLGINVSGGRTELIDINVDI